jgi:hypothetical protein
MPLTVTVPQVKARLNKTTIVDDAELGEMIDAAEAAYAEHVRPLPSTLTVRVSGGFGPIILPLGTTAVTAATYADGTVIDTADFDVDPASGLLHLGAGYLARGTRNVLLTVTVGDLPAHHREAIIADVAGYFAATQRGNSPGALPDLGYEAAYAERTTPMVLFPRILALATSSVA